VTFFLNIVASGLVVGSIYGLVGMAFAIIFRTTRVLNFAQGEVMMLVTYTTFSLAASLHLSIWTLVPCALLGGALVGVVVERLFIRPMIGQPVFAIVMVTIGLAIFLRSLTILIWGVDAENFQLGFMGQVVRIGPVVLLSEQILVIATFVVVVLAIFLFFKYTRLGGAMRAAAEDETAALLMGINVKRISSLAWAMSAVISGLAGIMLALLLARSPDMWFAGLKSFPAAILGGLDSPLGSAFGGWIVGVIGEVSEGYVGRGLKEIAGFVVIVVILMVRPFGLFGEPDLERV
jgi:branched-chain amino acid transport system permease protein